MLVDIAHYFRVKPKANSSEQSFYDRRFNQPSKGATASKWKLNSVSPVSSDTLRLEAVLAMLELEFERVVDIPLVRAVGEPPGAASFR